MADSDNSNETDQKGTGLLGGAAVFGTAAAAGLATSAALRETAIELNNQDDRHLTLKADHIAKEGKSFQKTIAQRFAAVRPHDEDDNFERWNEERNKAIKEVKHSYETKFEAVEQARDRLAQVDSKLKATKDAGFFEKAIIVFVQGNSKVKAVVLTAALSAGFLASRFIARKHEGHAARIADEQAPASSSAGRTV